MENDKYIFGVRAVLEAIEAGKEIDKILVKKDLSSELAEELLKTAYEHRVVVQKVPVEKINRITRKNHQGVVAFLSAVTYYKLEHLVPQLYESGRVPFVVLLDGLTDVRNFGAIARTCDCAGVDAIVIPERNSVSAGADAVKTSAGALHYLPVCREHSLAWAVRFLKDSGYKVYGASEKAQQSYIAPDYTTPVAIVMGSEEKGISDEILRLCDGLVAVPEYGHINSLNVSVATGIIVYEVLRQRNLNGDKDI